MKEAEDGMKKYECKLSKRLEREHACLALLSHQTIMVPWLPDLHIPPKIAGREAHQIHQTLYEWQRDTDALQHGDIQNAWDQVSLKLTPSRIPDGGNLLTFILYADKTKLSSFSTSKGYPVVMHCANLPTLVAEDPKDSKKPDFVNLKSLKTGCWVECSDGIQQWIFPVVLILSADYEEQCMMSLICGSNSKQSCPICLIKGEELADISRTWPLRMAGDTQRVIQDAQNLQSAAKCEDMLSDYGICDVKNVFWDLHNSDPHHALLFDWLHSNNSSLFGHHLWEQFKALITRYGHSQQQQIDTQFNAVPHWSGLVHFPGAHNVIPSHNKAGWLLLCCLQSFAIVDLYLAFEAHTEHTIKSGQCELANFAKYIKLNEKLHGPLKKFYLMQTNFKNIGPQILKVEHLKFVFSLIHSQINETEHQKNVDEDVDDPPKLSSLLLDSDVIEAPQLVGHVLMDGHIILRSQQPMTSFTSMGDSFCTSLASWLTKELPSHDIVVPSPIEFCLDDQIAQY
ncbi:hypothetical protein BJV74DRAFT_799089 [Russula compacta]|nr:hypothetical protein BJV74DRAFT_799089 [Russula compacta]